MLYPPEDRGILVCHIILPHDQPQECKEPRGTQPRSRELSVHVPLENPTIGIKHYRAVGTSLKPESERVFMRA